MPYNPWIIGGVTPAQPPTSNFQAFKRQYGSDDGGWKHLPILANTAGLPSAKSGIRCCSAPNNAPRSSRTANGSRFPGDLGQGGPRITEGKYTVKTSLPNCVRLLVEGGALAHQLSLCRKPARHSDYTHGKEGGNLRFGCRWSPVKSLRAHWKRSTCGSRGQCAGVVRATGLGLFNGQ